MTLREAIAHPQLSDSEKLYAAGWLQGFERRPEPFEIYGAPSASVLAEAFGWTLDKAGRIEALLVTKGVELLTPDDYDLAQLRRPLTTKQRALWLKELGDEQGWACLYCGRPGENATCGPGLRRWVLEHKTPLSRGGLSTRDNMALSCHQCNVKKRNRTAGEFQREMACS